MNIAGDRYWMPYQPGDILGFCLDFYLKKSGPLLIQIQTLE